MNFLHLLFSFKGRIGRQQYWLGSLAVGVLGFVVMNLSMTSMGVAGAMGKPAMPSLTSSLGLLVMSLALGWAGLAIQFKRFHDRGRSGFWSFLPIVPVLLMIDAVFSGIARGAEILAIAQAIQPWLIALLVINLGFFIDLGCLSGTDGPNKYDHTPGSGGGSAPKAPSGKPQPAGAAALGSAELAMERAIAQRTQAARAAPARVMPSAPVAAPLSPQSTTPGSFGRRAR